ncbi:class I SAM-dependent methyltransferase [Nocardioides marinisabuli]|uniref:class I SAM-dependent methyltransferase n=1 Tax=Nocardioides marinisabuli TaxID=419476 RepID=UPI001FEA8F98|nr:class I SAM-dependent methyltransferase [Nocardioides marinisabuli]
MSSTKAAVSAGRSVLGGVRAAARQWAPPQSARQLDAQAAAYWAGVSAPRWEADSHWESGLGEKWSAVGPAQVDVTRRLLASLGRDVPAGRIVDWGCGGGANAVALAPLCDELVVVDISAASLQECRRQVLARTGRAVRAVLTEPEAPQQAVDAVGEQTVELVVCFYVFELLASREAAVRVLRAVRRVLVEDGAAVIQFKYDDGTRSGAIRRRDYQRRVAGTTFAVHDFWTLCESEGLRPHTLTLVTRDQLDSHYAYVLLTRPPA